MLNPSDFGAFFEKYGPLVYRRARYLLQDHHLAEEATQEVFVRAIKSAKLFRHRSKVSTWLVRITTNYCLNLIRDASRRRQLMQERLKNQEAGPASQPAPEEYLHLQRLLARADERCARAAVYVFADGMSHAEAAEMLGVSRRTVGNLIKEFVDWAEKQDD